MPREENCALTSSQTSGAAVPSPGARGQSLRDHAAVRSSSERGRRRTAGLGSAALQSRSSGWKSWTAFAQPRGIPLHDFSDHNRALWYAHMFSHPGHQYKPGTLKTYASAIRSVITESGRPQPSPTGPLSQQMARAVASFRPPRRARKPITVPMLAKLKPHFDFSKQMDRSVWGGHYDSRRTRGVSFGRARAVETVREILPQAR